MPDVTKDSIRAAGGIVHSDGNVFFTNINQIKAMLATAQEQERKPLGQDWIEERAHRRCRRYIGIDTEAPYQFNAHTLMDLVRDIEAKIKEKP